MDITSLFTSQREAALLIGDYSTYRSQLSRRIRTLRKKLGRATPKNAKYSAKAPITVEDVNRNQEFVHLLLLSSERAWAHAMYMKAAHAEDNADQGITGSTRKHIISRLHKASKIARELVALLSNKSTGAVEQDHLEAQAYASTLAGAEEFEKQSEGIKDGEASAERWQLCLNHYAAARVIYNALLKSTRKDTYKEVLTSSVDPSIRYAAYSSEIPRTVAVATVAIKYFPREQLSALVPTIEMLDPEALVDPSSSTAKTAATDVPNTIAWRGRKANIVDAAIGQALVSVATAEEELSKFLKSATEDTTSRDKAGAYDDILIASQDAADATRHAIDELEKEGVEEADSRMQNLRVTSLAVNHDFISWRIGRDRILIGPDDGASFEAEKQRKTKRPRKDGKEWTEKPEGNGRRLARLRERVVLLDAILQSIDSIKDLRGAARDSAFIDELDAKRAYYQALKCLNIAHSHTLLGTPSAQRNALALLARAHSLATHAQTLTSTLTSPVAAPRLDPTVSQLSALASTLAALVTRYRALAHLHTVTSTPAQTKSLRPLVNSLDTYPAGGADLTNLVTYPPALQAVPVKPLFLDVAFNYIHYPGQGRNNALQKRMGNVNKEEVEEAPKKKGWFGFGR